MKIKKVPRFRGQRAPSNTGSDGKETPGPERDRRTALRQEKRAGGPRTPGVSLACGPRARAWPVPATGERETPAAEK